MTFLLLFIYLFIAFEMSWKKSAFSQNKTQKNIKMLMNGHIQIV